jgi:serine/threonine protein phosphatase PrpC
VSRNSDDLSSSRVEILYATREDKPHLQEERKRIEDMGGQVYIPPSHKLDSTSRVMYSNVQEGSGIHGLAMSRSLGDWTAGKVGVIPNPIVDVLDLRDYLFVNESLNASTGDTGIRSNVNIFAFSATDGLLDYLSEQDIAERVSSSFYQEEGIHPLLVCESLILEAAGRWWKAKGGRYRDDISIAISKLSVS